MRGFARTAVVEPCLDRGRGVTDADKGRARAHVQPGLLLDAPEDVLEDRRELPARKHGEVQVLREPVRLDVALLEAGAALEGPRGPQPRVGPKAPKHPTDGVVLLDDLLAQARIPGKALQLVATDHALPGAS